MESLSGDARQMVAFRSLSIINTWPIETKSAIMVPPTGVKANEILVG